MGNRNIYILKRDSQTHYHTHSHQHLTPTPHTNASTPMHPHQYIHTNASNWLLKLVIEIVHGNSNTPPPGGRDRPSSGGTGDRRIPPTHCQTHCQTHSQTKMSRWATEYFSNPPSKFCIRFVKIKMKSKMKSEYKNIFHEHLSLSPRGGEYRPSGAGIFCMRNFSKNIQYFLIPLHFLFSGVGNRIFIKPTCKKCIKRSGPQGRTWKKFLGPIKTSDKLHRHILETQNEIHFWFWFQLSLFVFGSG